MHILEQNIEILAELAGDYDSDNSDYDDGNILEWLSSQPHVVPLLERNPDYINWYGLSSNKAAIHILEKNIDNMNWRGILHNENAIDLIRNYDGDGYLDYLYILTVHRKILFIILKLNHHVSIQLTLVSLNRSSISREIMYHFFVSKLCV